MSEYYTDGKGRVHCYDSYRLRELGLPKSPERIYGETSS